MAWRWRASERATRVAREPALAGGLCAREIRRRGEARAPTRRWVRGRVARRRRRASSRIFALSKRTPRRGSSRARRQPCQSRAREQTRVGVRSWGTRVGGVGSVERARVRTRGSAPHAYPFSINREDGCGRNRRFSARNWSRCRVSSRPLENSHGVIPEKTRSSRPFAVSRRAAVAPSRHAEGEEEEVECGRGG